MLVAADALQRAPERRAQHRPQEGEYSDEQGQHEIIDVPCVGEIERREAPDRRDRLEVHADAVRSAAELRVVEDEIEHLRERERHHDEVDALHAYDEHADRQRRECRGEHRRRQREPEVRRLVLRAHQPQRIGADPEVRGVAERDETGIADEEIEREREDREDHDLRDELDVEPGARQRKQREQRDDGDERDRLPLRAGRCDRWTRHPPTRLNRPSGRQSRIAAISR
jgi:hypothetical protein